MSKKPSLADLRAKFKQKAENKKGFSGPSDVYLHWEIPEGSSATVRILPDKNEENENFFYVDKLEHKLSINGKDRKIPCIKMYGEKCPICELSSKYYKAEGKESVQGKYYYFKRTSLMKALIIKDPIENGESSEGQVKTLQFTYQLMNLINNALANEEEETALDELPWDTEHGHNFLISKTKQGQYDNYSTSAFSKKVSSIPEKWEDAVEEGMVDLSTLLPKNPGLEAVQALLEAHLSGGDVDDEDKEDDEDDMPIINKRRQPKEDEDEDEMPVKRRKPIAESHDEDEDEDEDEAPVIKKRKPIVDEDDGEDEKPVIKKRKPVVADDEDEDDMPVIKKRKPAAVTVDDDEDEDEDEDALIKRIRASRRRED